MTRTQQQLIESLLYEEESETLDFKRDLYRFEKATDYEKAELLKDILAFGNAWRRTDAYILIGVEEIKGAKSKVVGVSKHLEDASLQQFVNSKTQRPVHFSYQACLCEGKPVGIIHIPVQERPLYLKCKFGGLHKHVVYVRRGTSTVEAEPDEVAKMRAFDSAMPKPSLLLELFFFDKETGECGGRELNICSGILHFPEHDKIPEYGTLGVFGLRDLTNKDYYRELADYYSLVCRVAPVGFAVKNAGKAIASNVRLEIQVDDIGEDYLFFDSLPEKPSKTAMSVVTPLNNLLFKDAEVTIKRYTNSWFIQVRFGNVQPGQIANNECSFYFGASRSCVLTFDGVVFADERPEPIRFPMSIHVEANEKHMDIETFLKNIQTD